MPYCIYYSLIFFMKIQTLNIRTYLTATTLALALLLSTVAFVQAGQDKVTVCHKGKHEVTVGAPAVDAHLAHGDTVGACDDGGGGDPDPV